MIFARWQRTQLPVLNGGWNPACRRYPMNMAVSPEEIMERYTRGVVGLDDAVDYFYKRLYPRRYRWLQSAPRRAKRCRDFRRYGIDGDAWTTFVGDLPFLAVGWILLPLFSLHYRKASAALADTVRANRQPTHSR